MQELSMKWSGWWSSGHGVRGNEFGNKFGNLSMTITGASTAFASCEILIPAAISKIFYKLMCLYPFRISINRVDPPLIHFRICILHVVAK